VMVYETDDYHSIDYSNVVSTPSTFAIVFSFDKSALSGDDNDGYIIGDLDSTNKTRFFTQQEASSNPFSVAFDDGVKKDGGSDTNWHIATILKGSSTTILRIDGDEKINISGSNNDDTGSLAFSSLPSVGSSFNTRLFVGEFLHYESDKSLKFSDIESYLSPKWGITI
jgi:hypothetical protein